MVFKQLCKSRIGIGRWAVGLMLMAFTHASHAFTKSGTIYTTDGSQADVQAAVTAASPGDTVNIPAGTFTWGANGTSVSIGSAITLQGAGTNTTIVLASTGPTYGNAVIGIYAAATVQNFSVTGSSLATVTALSATGNSGWRITGITYNGGTVGAYFCYVENSYGLIDHCNVNGGVGTAELIFMRGPVNSWQTPDSMGTTNAIYIENCTFGGQGYVCDANSNARAVIRFCTITGQIKIDGHGKASNTPARGVRHMEIYGNYWSVSAYFTAIEIRGGTGMCFNNTNSSASGNTDWLFLTDYGYTAQWPNFLNVFQTPVNYPVDDQIGVGQDPKVAGSDPYYLWNNSASGADWFLQWKDIPAAANTLYGVQIGNVLATFTMSSVIRADKDYFKGTLGSAFNGSSGVGMGTKAQMLAITPTKTGVGFWVTDEAQWNTTTTGTSGQLYNWNGTAWTLKYTPLTYPHPLAAAKSQANTVIGPPTGLKASSF